MRLLYPSEAANPLPTVLMSTYDLLELVFSPHGLKFMGLFNGFYSFESEENNSIHVVVAPSPECDPVREDLLDSSSREYIVMSDLASLSVSHQRREACPGGQAPCWCARSPGPASWR